MKLLNVILLLIFAVSSQAQTTEFTFQGKLNESGTPVSSPRDIRFRLWNAETNGTQIAGDVTVANVAFVTGVFSVKLDFGDTAFTGEPRWIEIGVGQPGAGLYTTLQPRQSLGSSPYAIKSLNSVEAETAQFATTAQDSNSLGGVAASQYVQTVDTRLSDARDPLPGSASYIQNQNAAPQASTNFNVSGTGTANILRAETQFNLGTSRVFHSPGTNLFVGRSTGTNFTTGLFNTVVGGTAGNGMINASANSIFGNGAGFDNQGSENSFFGMHAGQQNQSGGANSFFGKDAGAANLNGVRNSFFGIGAGAGNTIGNDLTLLGSAANVGADGLNFATAIGSGAVVGTSDTIVLGKAAGNYNGVGRPADTVHTPGIFNAGTQFNLAGSRILSSGFNTLAVGHLTGNNGQFNTFVGTFAGNKNTGNDNVFVGSLAGLENLAGSSNVFVGSQAGRKTTTGQGNSMFGTFAGNENTTANANSFFGGNAGSRNTGGNFNTFVGSDANFTSANATGSGNTLLGWLATVASGVNDATAIGVGAQVTQNNTIVLGRSSETVQVPGSLTVAGTFGAFSLNA
ncbi:MAG TPA: hypothetical protein VJV05_14310, partial [Pyrinomonadaceae bacterium]|nr:hypothetical protein [Pyrinomonadaceae bacterium]